MRQKLLFLLFFLSVFSLSFTQASKPRIRKSFSSLSERERDLVLKAIENAMKDREYIEFTEMHIDKLSSDEGHAEAVFIYWHRMLLLIFENMIRSMGPEYADLTVPYWDYLSDSTQHVDKNGHVKNPRVIGQCDVAVATGSDFSGYNRGDIPILNDTIRAEHYYRCVDTPNLKYYDGSYYAQPNNNLKGCLPRGRWSRTRFPFQTSLFGVHAQLFPELYPDQKGLLSSTDVNIIKVSKSIQIEIHNTLHKTLHGAMGTFAAPSDPVFFFHHATLDLLHTIHINCRVGTKLKDANIRVQSPYYWLDSVTKLGKYIRATDPITIQVQGKHGPVHVQTESPGNGVYKFAKDLPSSYIDYTDPRDLGEFSYSYEIEENGLLWMLNEYCDKAIDKYQGTIQNHHAQPFDYDYFEHEF